MGVLLRAVSHFSLAICPALVSSLLCSYCALMRRARDVACAPCARGQERCHGPQELAETALDGYLGTCEGGDGPHHASRAHAGDRRLVSPNPRGLITTALLVAASHNSSRRPMRRLTERASLVAVAAAAPLIAASCTGRAPPRGRGYFVR